MNRTEQILQAVRDLAPTIRARSAEIENARRMPSDLLTELTAVGCFRMLVPKTHGGDEIDLLSSIDILEMLSAVDGATGWTVMIGCEAPLLACLLPRETFAALYAKGPDVIIGGAFAPQGTAQVVDGGYRVTGRWAFASGCQHCAWLFGNCVVIAQGNPRPGPLEGMPETRAMLVRADEVEILDTWKVSGLRGTGSHDLAMTDLFVPTSQTFDIFWGRSSIPELLFFNSQPSPYPSPCQGEGSTSGASTGEGNV